jgi:hypothetical protein
MYEMQQLFKLEWHVDGGLKRIVRKVDVANFMKITPHHSWND